MKIMKIISLILIAAMVMPMASMALAVTPSASNDNDAIYSDSAMPALFSENPLDDLQAKKVNAEAMLKSGSTSRSVDTEIDKDLKSLIDNFIASMYGSVVNRKAADMSTFFDLSTANGIAEYELAQSYVIDRVNFGYMVVGSTHEVNRVVFVDSVAPTINALVVVRNIVTYDDGEQSKGYPIHEFSFANVEGNWKVTRHRILTITYAATHQNYKEHRNKVTSFDSYVAELNRTFTTQINQLLQESEMEQQPIIPADYSLQSYTRTIRKKVVDYAVMYGTDDNDQESWNSAYTNYHNMGGDCTNFVSQCLYAAGFGDDTIGTGDPSKWSYSPTRTPSWAGAAKFREYCRNNDMSGNGRYGWSVTTSSTLAKMNIGDVIQLCWATESGSADHSPGHTIVVTKLIKTNGIVTDVRYRSHSDTYGNGSFVDRYGNRGLHQLFYKINGFLK